MVEPQTPQQPASWFSRFRGSNVALCLPLVAALVIFVGVVNQHYAIGQWLAWRYLLVSALALFWAVACLSGGYFLLERLRIRLGSQGLEAALAFPLGVFGFQIAMFLLGLVGLLGVATFVLLPTLFAFSGAARVVAAVRHLRKIEPPRGFFQVAVILFGCAGAALIYFPILSPENFHWDARWYHLPIAQQYALQGAIRPFPEGWWLDGQPHSASLIYAWAFLLPGSLLFDRLELCIHLEFVVFLATLASIPPLVRQLAPGVKARGAWAAVFLFPGIFLYDSNLSGGADHIAALWCIPVALSLIRLWEKWEVPEAILFGTFMAAGLASKFSAWSMLVLPGLLFLARAIWLAAARVVGRDRSGQRLLAPFVFAAAAMLLLSGQHWLRNLIWYGDPVYPVLAGHLRVRPWSPEADASYRLFKSFTFPPLPGLDGVWEALKTTMTFSFKPNNWPVFHGRVPVFGSLFTLSMLCLPFVRAGARLWLAYVSVLVAVACWYFTSHQDRYIQAWLPAMVACTVATFGLVWARRSLAVRGLLTALVALQIIWGGDVPFFPTHNMINDSPLRLVSNFLASGFLRKPDRLRVFAEESRVGERLPPDANLLLHEAQLSLGFGVRTVTDQWQGRLSYATLASPAAIYRELTDLKITHLLRMDKMTGWNSLGNDLAFLGFYLNHAIEPFVVGEFVVGRFPTQAPPESFNDRVAMLTCGTPYPRGIYRVAKLTVPAPGQPGAAPEGPITDEQAAIREAGFLVVDPNCMPNLPPEVGVQFHPPVPNVRGPHKIYVRR